MTKRILLAGVLAGIALFAWGAISHMVLGLSEVGIKAMPNEEPVLSAMSSNLKEPGFYFFPGGMETPEQQQAAEEKYRKGPIGILIYQPTGRQPWDPMQFGTEFLKGVVAAIIAAWLLSQTSISSFLTRALFVALVGFVGSLDVHGSYWNWYGFPTNYTLAALADEFIGWFVAGLLLAGFIKPAS